MSANSEKNCPLEPRFVKYPSPHPNGVSLIAMDEGTVAQ